MVCDLSCPLCIGSGHYILSRGGMTYTVWPCPNCFPNVAEPKVTAVPDGTWFRPPPDIPDVLPRATVDAAAKRCPCCGQLKKSDNSP